MPEGKIAEIVTHRDRVDQHIGFYPGMATRTYNMGGSPKWDDMRLIVVYDTQANLVNGERGR